MEAGDANQVDEMYMDNNVHLWRWSVTSECCNSYSCFFAKGILLKISYL